MSKTVSFTSDVWGGSVTFSDPLTLEQEAAWEYGIAAYQEAVSKGGGLSAQGVGLLQGILPCVEKWELKSFPERPTLANFPTRPRDERAKLMAWLVDNIRKLYEDSTTLPNE